MKFQLAATFALLTLVTTQADAIELDKVHDGVRIKLEKYCPQTLAEDEIQTLKTDEIVTINEIDYYAEEERKIPDLVDETLVLCAGKFAQNRSTPGRIYCEFCKEEQTRKPLVAVSTQITRDVDEIIAKRGELEDELTEEIEISDAISEEDPIQPAAVDPENSPNQL